MKSNTPIKILLVEDDEDDYILTVDTLDDITHFNGELEWVTDFDEALMKIRSNQFDVCLIDYRLGEFTGIQLIEAALKNYCQSALILLTGQGDKAIDFMAMQVGASDYLIKDELSPSVLERSIRYAINNNSILQKLNKNEKKYRSLFQESIDPIFLTSRILDFTDCNSAMSQLFLYTHEKFLTMNLKDLLSESDVEGIMEEISNEGFLRDYETILRDKEGNKKMCQMTISSLRNEDNDIIGFQGIIHDVSVKKKAEKELRMAERLSMTGKIARTIAHEVRNPLTNLNLALGQLTDELSDKAELGLYTDIIQRNANRIEQLIIDMLNSSKPQHLQLERQCINDSIENALVLVQDRINLKGMNLNKELSDELPDLIIDKAQLKTALLNIMINAIEAMKQGEGKLEVRSALDKNGTSVRVSIRDNGKGIDKADLDKLFDPFFTAKKGGMGLGLTSVQNIISSHEGSIEVESDIGMGTVFHLCFPIPKK